MATSSFDMNEFSTNEDSTLVFNSGTSIDQSDYAGNSVLTVISTNSDPQAIPILVVENKNNVDDVLEMKEEISDGSNTEIYLGENTHVRMLEVVGDPQHTTSYGLGGGSTLELTPKFLQTTHPFYLSGYDNDGQVPPTIIYDSGGGDVNDLTTPIIAPKAITDTTPSLPPGTKIQVIGATRLTNENGTLNFTDNDGNVVGRFDVHDVDQDQFNFDSETGTMQIACFLKGTHIATPYGEVKVESLKSGDCVLTASGGVAIVKWLGYRTLYKNKIPEKDKKRAFPILFKKGCIADNVPHCDLIMSPGHHVYFDGYLVPAMMLVNGKSIVQQFQMQSFQYFHVELEQFDILLAEGVPAESYVDTGNRNMFQNAQEVALNPDFGPARGRPDVSGVTVIRKGPVVEAIKAKLLERANWMQTPVEKRRSA